MKRALVTGASGFVGRHMVKELRERGYRVFAIDLHFHHSLAELTSAGGDWLFVEGQGDAVDWLRSGGWECDWDLVVHCAYHIGGRAGIDGESRNLARNLALDAALFDWAAARRDSIGRILYFSSSAVYPVNMQERPGFFLRETDTDWDQLASMIGLPDARYGWAKLTGEKLAEAYREQGGRVSVVRPFSGYGADQSTDYPFPSFVRKAKAVASGETDAFEVWGDPKSTRDWIHISDVVKGALAVCSIQAEGREAIDWSPGRDTEPVNLCTGVATSFGDLAIMMMLQAGVKGDEVLTGHKHVRSITGPTGVMHRVGDPKRMLSYYKPQVPLFKGIEEAIHG